MNQIVRFRAKTGRAWTAGRAQGQADGLLDAVDNVERIVEMYAEGGDIDEAVEDLARVATALRARAAELRAEAETIVAEGTQGPWWRRALSALRVKW